MSKIKRLFNLLKMRKGFYKLFLNYESGYLYETGWSRSVIEKKPVDKDGNPLPWISIPAIELLKEKDLKNLFLFEYGSGNSTFWFSSKVKHIISVEHDKNWFDYVFREINKKGLSNINLIYKKLEYGGEYSKEILRYNNIDIVLVDGRDRVNCTINSVNQLSKKGVIILDDSQRVNYKLAIEFLKNKGFKELKLVGMNLGSVMKKSTSIFYRQYNCLGL